MMNRIMARAKIESLVAGMGGATEDCKTAIRKVAMRETTMSGTRLERGRIIATMINVRPRVGRVTIEARPWISARPRLITSMVRVSKRAAVRRCCRFTAIADTTARIRAGVSRSVYGTVVFESLYQAYCMTRARMKAMIR